MNILIPDSWLKDYLKTKATPQKIAECLSLCGASVEKVSKVNNDYVYDIEITTNRIDMASVQGIAREIAAILPRFGIKAKFISQTLQTPKIPKKGLPLNVQIKNPFLCPRFTAVILNHITINPSPKIIQERLEKSGIRALNNVVDISNYFMLELGQPMHTFDYDKIKNAKMILRESKKGEKITTLDNQVRKLPDGAIIIEDNEKRIIDLCGIMGGKNSEVDQNTKRVLLFVQTYNPIKIRKACQSLGFRTDAASRFEKDIDPEGVFPAIKKAITMFEKNCSAKIASPLIDLYPHPPKPKKVFLSQEKLNQAMGVEFKLTEAKKILEDLGFTSNLEPRTSNLISTVPHWRHHDISIPEDLIEEVARIYGYHNLPTRLPTGEFPKPFQGPFSWEEKTKNALKYWGFTEVYNYSLVAQELLEKTGFDFQNCLKLSNPLTSEWEYMRPSLIPGILQTIACNQSREEVMKIFELSKIYIPIKEKLPNEKTILVGVLTGENFYQAKGITEAFLNTLGIKNNHFSFKILPTIVGQKLRPNIWHPGRTATITLGNLERSNLSKGSTSKNSTSKTSTSKIIGTVGEIHPQVLEKFAIEKRVTIFELDFEEILKHATLIKTYLPIPKYPSITEDLAFLVSEKTLVGEIIKEIKKINSLIIQVKLLDNYKNTRTFRITYQHSKKTLTDQEVKKIREKIIRTVSKKFKAEIKY
ncbi:phenylalanine--tRNA ligase subunit beta [Candidatus Microgenomates bacterium]|nr:phenylalanine--tRNA ligase subunit beta [Candidatus Microgenomates bacterium]